MLDAPVTLRFLPLGGKAKASARLADRRINIWEGSVRSAKTVSSILAWIKFVRGAPPGELLMTGKTERTLKRNVIHPMQDMLGQSRARYVQGDGELHVCGRRIYIAGANDERAQEKIRGLTLAGAYVDEVSTIPESFWSMLLTRLSVEGASLFGTTNPDNPRHWLLKDYLDRASVTIDRDGSVKQGGDGETLDLARFRFQLADNPHLPQAYITALEREFVGLWYRRFILGEWVAAEGSVFPMLDLDPNSDTTHVVADLPPMRDWVLAIDYGTASVFHCILIGVGTDDRLYFAREWRWDAKRNRGQLTDTEFSERLARWVTDGCDGADEPGMVVPSKVIVDPSATSFIRQLHRDGWPSVRLADNAVIDGIRNVSTLLAARRLLFHESVKDTMDEHAGYVWDDKATAVGEDKPLKQDDHAPDAGRYGVVGLARVWRHWVGASA